ncbi:FAD-binding domain-containing protein [Parathielavia appendiculata]|uniref:FAD-binding domain-containing protein n=1 Tax=Parathielavia appendiculata TaxID=2587402 RepID=A0AAN6TRJ1_9PEZI|nr:FAD-binding domain-containing protein [Parathielavia appendiculata]
MSPLGISLAIFLLAFWEVVGKTFSYESIRLDPADSHDFPAIRFDNKAAGSPRTTTTARCRAWPGSNDWPSDSEWQQLNTSLGGALLKPLPPASACYQGDQYNESTCRWLVNQAGRTHFWLDDPLSTLTQWPQGSTCTLVSHPQGSCTRGGFPEYVVNATTVKQVQAAVNFARNKNLRLVIKNTGHDFGGRSMGAGSLSIWVHNLKSFEFIPHYRVGQYSGMAVHVGAGVESWEHHNHMAAHNIAVVAPGGSTVGAVGGWISVAGHGLLTSKYGLGADQVLSNNIVTADGHFLTVDPNNHKDLWWALRGGGPSTFGVITSVVLKAYPAINITSTSLSFTVNPFLPLNRTLTPNSLTNITSFWNGVSLAYHYCAHIIAAGGLCYSYIYPLGNSSFTFTSSQTIPNITAPALTALLSPLYTQLNTLHTIPVTLPTLAAIRAVPYAGNSRRTGAAEPANTRYRSRLFPSYVWGHAMLWAEVFASVRAAVEDGGYTFHGIAYSPTAEMAGWPGRDSAVHEAWRATALHAILNEVQPEGITAEEARGRDARVQAYVDRWQELMPDAGAYMNEGDPAESNWQDRFYGSHYQRLLGIKREWDPWGVFWARTTVGSEEWAVITLDGYPAGQNGRLCRVQHK